jgi:hypothetical protein
MDKLIMVLPLYYKKHNPESIQGGRLKRALEKRGIEVDVIDETSLLSQIGSLNYKFMKLLELFLLTLKRLSPLFLRDLMILNEPYSIYNTIYSRLIESKLINWPDAIILTSSTPFSIHEVGLRIKSIYGNKWIIRMSDPFVDNPYNKARLAIIRRFQRQKEKKYFNSANAITVSSDNYYALLRKEHIDFSSKIYLIYHSMSEGATHSVNNNQSFDYGYINGVYIGNIYGKRNPYYFFKAIEADYEFLRSKNVQIHFYGKVQSRYRVLVNYLGIGSIIQFHGIIKHSDVTQLLSQCDFYINLESNDNPNPFFPSKLTDYLYFNKPILNLATNDSISRRLINHEKLSANPSNISEVKHSMRYILDNLNTNFSYLKGELSIDNILEKYLLMIENMRTP